MSESGFYYLHTDGSLIYKPASVANDPGYFDSPFVKKVWPIDTTKRETAWFLILEALAMGCNLPRAKELADKWKMDFDDSVNALINLPEKYEITDTLRDGIELFVEKILEMNIEEYWEKIRGLSKCDPAENKES